MNENANALDPPRRYLAAPDPRYFVSPVKACAHSLVTEHELPPGKKLVRCGRCKEVYYVGRVEQKIHWETAHRKVCCPIEEDHALVRDGQGFEGFLHCIQVIAWILEDPLARIKGRLLLYALQQFRSYLMDTDLCLVQGRGPVNAAAYEFVLLPFNGLWDHKQKQQIIERIWAIPGALNYFLQEDIYISPVMLQRKMNGLAPPENETFIAHRVKDPVSAHPSDFRLKPPYVQLLEILFSITATLGMACSDCLSENGSTLDSGPRQSSLALCAAVTRIMMRAWADPFARASIPSWEESGSFTRNAMFSEILLGALRRRRDLRHLFGSLNEEKKEGFQIVKSSWLREGELAPGMTAKAMLLLLMEDKNIWLTLEQNHSFDLLIRLLVSLDQDNDNCCKSCECVELESSWGHKFISPAERLHLLDRLFQEYYWDEILINYRLKNQNGDRLWVLNRLLYLISAGESTKAILDMHKALQGPLPTPPQYSSVNIVEGVWNSMVEDSVLVVETFLETVVDMRRERLGQDVPQSSHSDAVSHRALPEELIKIIAEYALPSGCTLFTEWLADYYYPRPEQIGIVGREEDV